MLWACLGAHARPTAPTLKGSLDGKNFQPAEALKALTWFKGGDLPSLSQEVQRGLAGASARVKDLPAIPEVRSGLGGGPA